MSAGADILSDACRMAGAMINVCRKISRIKARFFQQGRFGKHNSAPEAQTIGPVSASADGWPNMQRGIPELRLKPLDQSVNSATRTGDQLRAR